MTNEPSPQQPTWLDLHEFECEPEEIDLVKLRSLTSTPMCEEMASHFKECDVIVYKLIREFGEKDWFHRVEM